MSAESAQPKRKQMDPPSSLPTGMGDCDHRKHRRNRIPKSCLPCHIAKRKCDRKRPCGRCTQLGKTRSCVYEIVRPSPWIEDADDKMYHQRRMVELQSVFREFINEPRPRSSPSQLPSKISEGQQEHTFYVPNALASLAEHSSSSRIPHTEENVGSPSPLLEADGTSAAPLSVLKWPPLQEGSLAPRSFEALHGGQLQFPIDLSNPTLASYSTSSILSPSNIASAIPLPTFSTSPLRHLSYLASADPQSDLSLSSLWGITPHNVTHGMDSRNPRPFDLEHQIRLEGCGCLSEVENHYAVLELSQVLRRAAGVLSRYPLHNEGSTCRLKQHMTDLYALISTMLGSVDTSGMSGFRQAQLAQLSDVGLNPLAFAPREASLAGSPVAFPVLAAHPETFATPSYHSQTSWISQQPWNVLTTSMPSSSWANTLPNHGYN